MQELLLVNPRKRRKSAGKKRRTAAQRAATKRLVAMNRARKSNPTPRKRRRKSTRAKARRASSTVVVRTNPHKRRVHRRGRRRNPISLTHPMGILKPALVGAVGATAVNTALGYVGQYLPSSLMTGNMLIATRAVSAFLLGMVAGKLGVRGSTVTQMAEGSLTVTLHDAIMMLSGGFGMQLQGMRGMRMYMPGIQAGAPAKMAGLNSYVTGAGAGMGSYITGSGSLGPLKSRAGKQMSGMGF